MESISILEVLSNTGIDTLGLSVLIIVLFSLIQISPIEINPWSFIARVVGNALNKDVIRRINDIEEISKASRDEMLENYKETKHEITGLRKELYETKQELYETRAISCRVRILHFEDEVQHNIRHSKESFDQVMSDITYYENYCENNPKFLNNMIDIVIKHIKDVYTRQLQTHDFD